MSPGMLGKSRRNQYIRYFEYMSDLPTLVSTLKTLADETRLRIVHLLWRSDGPLTVSTLVEILRRPQPTVSRHLGQLRRAGVVEADPDGTERHYRLARVQRRLHAAVLAVLEDWVPSTPQARADLRRLQDLTRDEVNATKESHMSLPEDPAVEASTTEVLRALSHPTRRRLLDGLGAQPGRTMGEVAAGFAKSRAAIGKHLAVLERAGLVVSRREGRQRRLYHNPVPVQLLYDRWTTRYSAPLARHMAAVKYAVEGRKDD